MDPAVRRRIGGWAAFAIAGTIPFLAAAVLTARPDTNPFSTRNYEIVELIRGVAIATAAWGLAAVIAFEEMPWSRVVTWLGILGGVGVAAFDAIDLAVDVESILDVPATVILNGLVSSWVIGFGMILSRSGEPLDRIGRAAQFGGGGSLVATVAVVIDQLGVANPTLVANLLRYGEILSLFTLLFVLRIGRFAAFGRLPERAPF